MEGILAVIGIYIAYIVGINVIRILFGKAVDVVAPNSSLSKKFRMKLVQSQEVIEDTKFNMFKFDIRGLIKGHNAPYNASFYINLFDTTNGERKPVLSLLEEYQYKDSRVFRYISTPERIPYNDTVFNDWVTITGIPTMFIEFPRKGYRTVEAEIKVVNSEGYILEETTATMNFNNEISGYMDSMENKDKFDEIVIKTALLVSNSDGNMDEDEANIIKDWVKRRLTGFQEKFQDEEKKRLNGYIRDAYFLVNDNKITVSSVLKDIDKIASEGEKYELFELCLKVASADGTADKDELKILDEIADYMGLDRTKFQSMIEKELPITMHAEQSNSKESMIGITPDMSNDEIKKHLRKEYTKWNSRVSNADENIRQQAEEMIQIISELRTQYR